MKIAEAMNKIATLQEGLSMDVGGRALTIEKAWPWPISGVNGAPSVPCMLNYWTFDRQHQSNGFREKFYTIKMELLIAERGSNTEDQCELAASVHDAFLDAFGYAITLNEGMALQDLRGDGTGADTTGYVTWNNQEYVALTYQMDLQLHDVFNPLP